MFTPFEIGVTSVPSDRLMVFVDDAPFGEGLDVVSKTGGVYRWLCVPGMYVLSYIEMHDIT